CLIAFKLQSIDWQTASNRQAHHTDRFYSKELILRRGQLFKFSLTLNQSLGSADGLTFTVSTGPSASESAKTKAVFPLSNETRSSGWSAQLLSRRDNVLAISILSPASAPIGRYELSIRISSQGKDSTLKLGTFILLFNPWLQGRYPNTPTPGHQLSEAHGVEMGGMVFMG
uniref:Transglutaminase N-terminal domain-containing protein n=1 Tax=Sus scrofa TaxID=9823 RepID=A0A8D0QE88_PIG